MQVTFPNHNGETLSGVIDEVKNPIATAIFAHCFTCSKDHVASYRICKALADHNIQVLRFDFTGLGKSQGDFSNHDFSDNVADIKSAIKFLSTNNTLPHLLIGHSLGGIAAVAAACELEIIQGVATIASPSRPSHVLEHFQQHLPQIEEQGSANITIFEQTFRFTQAFVQDLKSYDDQNFINNLHKPILIFHSPYDTIVSIDEAARIFTSAKHPKSFISLDKTDHLVSKKKDAEYIAENIASWARRYIKK